MGYFPLFYKITNKKILIVGGGSIALAKLETLVKYSDYITLLAPEFHQEIHNFIRDYKVTLREEYYREEFLDDYAIIVIATDDHDLNKEIADAARAKQKIVNLVDDADNSDFIFPAIVKRDEITIAISSSGLSPVLSRILKQRIEKLVPVDFIRLDSFIKRVRKLVKDKLQNIQARRMFWQELIEGNIGAEILAGNEQKADELFTQKLEQQSPQDEAALYLIGAGPGDPELITVKAINLLSRADIVLYDRLVSPEILDYARKDALKINVGKTKDFHKFQQDEINELIREYILEGKIVARLKGGDPAIFAHLYEEIEAIKDLNIPYQVVPGVSAANGAAAYQSIALTARDLSKSVRYVALYKDDMFNEDYWRDLANTEDSLVFYMSSSNASLIADNMLKHGRDGQDGMIVIEQATTKFQKSYYAEIANFSEKYGDQKFVSPSIIIIGKVVNKAQEFAWKEENETGKYFPDFTSLTNKGA